MSELDRSADLRCSSFIRAQDVDPVGTAGSYEGFLVVELPPPWPRDVSDIPGLTQVAALAKKRNIRIQAAAPQGAGPLSVALHTWRSDLGRYVGHEVSGVSDPARIALSLLENESLPARPVEVIDVLVCGHGGRDRCCGKFGVSLEMELRSAQVFDIGTVRLRRTSHLGGHRFAPTALLLGEGTSWGYLDAASLTAILTRRSGIGDYLRHYRGCTGLPSASLQALERQVLAAEGWEVLGRARHGSELGDGRFALEVEYPGKAKRRWEARVLTQRMVPVPNCGSAMTGDEKAEPELAVVDLAEVT